jgi:hypothetical protein
MEVTLHLTRTLAGGLEMAQVGSFPIFGGEKPYPGPRGEKRPLGCGASWDAVGGGPSAPSA